MAKKEPYDMTNNYARMERDKRKAIGNPNKNIHHKKNGSNYQKDTGSMVRQHPRPAGAGEDVHHHEGAHRRGVRGAGGGAGAAQHRMEG